MNEKQRSSNGHRVKKVLRKKMTPSPSTTLTESPEQKIVPARLKAAEADLVKGSKILAIVDSNVFIKYPNCLDVLLKDNHHILIPWKVLEELDVHKDYKHNGNKSDDSANRALQAQMSINYYLAQPNSGVFVSIRQSFTNLQIDKTRSDNRIFACINSVLRERVSIKSEYYSYQAVKLITNDSGLQITARVYGKKHGLLVEGYSEKKEKVPLTCSKIATINIAKSGIQSEKAGSEYYLLQKKDKFAENQPVLVYSDQNGSGWAEYRIAVRERKRLVFIDPNISASGIKALDNAEKNWEQMLALHLLKRPDLACVILNGPAGTGKTLLALAAGLEMTGKRQFDRIVVFRPMVPVGEGVGWIPGSLEHKVAPWMKPIFQNLSIIKKRAFKGVEGIKALEELKIDSEIIDFSCGTTYENTLIIVDDSQNLTFQEMLNLLSRVGTGSKIILTGDLNQIYKNHLTRESSGLHYAIKCLQGESLVGIVNFSTRAIVRSPFVKNVIEKMALAV